MIDYDELTGLLMHDESAMDASEVHGLLTGVACVAPESEDWRRLLPPAEDHPALANALDDMRSQTQAMLDEGTFAFTPLLPSDDAPIAERVAALAGWCRGFIDGLLAAGVADPTQLPDEAGEFMRDLTRIAEAEAPEQPSEEDENALAELVEYLRAGVGHVRDECHRSHGSIH